MKESVTYQAILEEGAAKGIAKGKAAGQTEEARRLLLLLGREKFGQPSASEQATLDAIADVNRLEQLALRVQHAASWQELLNTPGPRRRATRGKRSS